MEKVEILSHLTAKEWKVAWNDNVVEDTKKNVRAVDSKNCFLGHFENEQDFILYFHKEFEGSSLSTFFMGHLEDTKEGCRVTGHYTKKRTANMFLIFAMIITAVTTLAMLFGGMTQMAIAPAGLCAICAICFFNTPKSTKDLLFERLKKISFSESKRDRKHNKKKESKALKEDAKNADVMAAADAEIAAAEDIVEDTESI